MSLFQQIVRLLTFMATVSNVVMVMTFAMENVLFKMITAKNTDMSILLKNGIRVPLVDARRFASAVTKASILPLITSVSSYPHIVNLQPQQESALNVVMATIFTITFALSTIQTAMFTPGLTIQENGTLNGLVDVTKSANAAMMDSTLTATAFVNSYLPIV